MPIHILASAVFEGVSLLPVVIPLLKALLLLLSVWLLKIYFGGATNTSERLMHSKVVMITVSEARFSLASVADMNRVVRPALVQLWLYILRLAAPR